MRRQDSVDSGGSHQRERCQFEQLSRGANGENHFCQRQQGDANVTPAPSATLSVPLHCWNALPLSLSGPGGHGMGHQTIKHGNRRAGGDGAWKYPCSHGSGRGRQMIMASWTSWRLRHFLTPRVSAEPDNHSLVVRCLSRPCLRMLLELPLCPSSTVDASKATRADTDEENWADDGWWKI